MSVIDVPKPKKKKMRIKLSFERTKGRLKRRSCIKRSDEIKILLPLNFANSGDERMDPIVLPTPLATKTEPPRLVDSNPIAFDNAFKLLASDTRTSPHTPIAPT